MAESKSSLSLIEDAEREIFKGLYDRFDADAKTAQLVPYSLVNADGQEIPGGLSVTMNDPAVFLNVVHSWIQDAKWQVVIEGEISPTQEHLVETFLEDREEQAEEMLSKTEYGTLLPFLAFHICARGWISARRMWYVDEEGNPYLEIVPVDMRYCSYEKTGDEYNWVGVRYWRSKAAIKAEYDIDIRGTNNEIEVVDWWSGEQEEIWVDKKIIPATKERPMPNKHRIGYPPFVIVPAPEGFIFLDKGYKTRRGESIFFLNRGLYPELNRIASIDQSLALMALAPPYQRPVAPGEKPSPYPNEPGTTYDLPTEAKYELIPQPDINVAGRQSAARISGATQRGGINNIDLGNLQQPTSAIWITEQTEIRSKIVTPRLDAIADFFELSARMDIDMFQKGAFSGAIGRLGKRHKYEAGQLGDPATYSIKYSGRTTSKKQEIANMALFNASSGLSLETRLKDILLVDDWAGELGRIDAERAEQADPSLFYFRKAYSLAVEAKQLNGMEAKKKKLESIRLTQLGVRLSQPPQEDEQKKEPMPKEKTNSNLLMPLMGEGGGGGGNGQREPEEALNGRNQMG